MSSWEPQDPTALLGHLDTGWGLCEEPALTMEEGEKEIMLQLSRSQDTDERVNRITTIPEEDTNSDDIMQTNGKMKLVGNKLKEYRKKDVETWVEEFRDILTDIPGETSILEFAINTGDARPISQRPCMTALGLREGVEEELDWLLDKAYIIRSRHPQ